MPSSSPLSVAIIGTGYVADFYMRSKELHPEIQVVGVFDTRPARLKEFCDFWAVAGFVDLDALLAALPEDGLVVNLTTPEAHYDVSKACLEAGRHVYSEKPLATDIDQAIELTELAQTRGLFFGGAPCSYLSQAAQTLGAAVREEVCGPVRLVYAELDDGYLPQAPHQAWISESGAPWPYENEVRTGCTLEHAGYVLTWMISIFGSIRSITAFSDVTIEKGVTPETATPDTSIGILKFEAGPIVRLTCSIVAPIDHSMRVTGDKGVIEIKDTWDNYAPVKFRKRIRIRRRLLENPLPKRLRLASQAEGAKANRRGASTMDYFLGPREMLRAIHGGADNRCPPDLALHTTEAALVLQNAGPESTTHQMRTRCDPLPPVEWATRLR